jgi:hypothetical protein
VLAQKKIIVQSVSLSNYNPRPLSLSQVALRLRLIEIILEIKGKALVPLCVDFWE